MFVKIKVILRTIVYEAVFLSLSVIFVLIMQFVNLCIIIINHEYDLWIPNTDEHTVPHSERSMQWMNILYIKYVSMVKNTVQKVHTVFTVP